MRRYTFFIFLLFTQIAFSQKPINHYRHLNFRGKIIGTAILEDAYCRNLSLGAEFRFLKAHSIGIDYVHFRWRNEKDSTVNGVEYGSGPSVYSRRNYINIDYRCYPFKKIKRESGIDLYANLFMKIGKRNVWSSDFNILYSMGRERIYAHFSNFTDYGMALGLRFDFGSDDRIGIDTNIGVVRRFSEVWYEKGLSFDGINSSMINYQKYNDFEAQWAIHMRLNLYVKFLNLK